MARPLAFDPNEKLHQAMLLFWRKGFEATSMQDLVNALGINRFSIYNTFGDKQALYAKVVDYYEDKVFGALIRRLQVPEPGVETLEVYFQALLDGLTGQRGLCGCFLQTAILSGEVRDPQTRESINATFGRLQGALRDVIISAREKGDISPSADAEALADFLLMQVQGLIALQGLGKGEQARAALQVLLGQIRSW
ncbi:TetR/AcrR family transcriptional regulator [Pseudomaricurvus alkylphenolicus]|jgi:TetR/AcrR family transcriptional repressor of nem operon|uniref:TetR/AcrR family transcriptional regulator n=1 Tax=Pseudomaricurvus alkylphenolicus TaxID=1306991 RepID=UPI00141FE193|nr:TetR/AcrR family transcriptional regulator [Pseudomaricurvus alkylphenolicus]NIB43017.1 TetR/AcrR family transcriptional regulator [Pseudomaricurvus alkylphenolicus]